MTVRALVDHFSGGKSQIAVILKNKDAIIELYESNMRSESIRYQKRLRGSAFTDVNKALHK